MRLFQILDLLIISEKLIITNNRIQYKILNFIYTNYNKTILDLVLIGNYLTKAYIKFYILSKNYTKILFINNTSNYYKIINNTINLSNNYFINIKWIPGLLTNWKTFYKLIIVYNWLLLILNYLKYLKLNINIKLYIKLYKAIIKLHPICKGIKNLKFIPNYIFIIDSINNNKPVHEALILKKSIILIHKNPIILKYSSIPILGDNSENSINIILSIFNLAWLQAKLNI